MLAEEEALLEKIDGVDYDVEDYVHELRQLLDAKLSRLGNLQGKEEGGKEKVPE